ncbi:PspC domain-containing protein [Micrococcales bacterium 31B]|nr:PspC domain-containing protein [Micrococcales bacterium 31B]
MNPLFEAIRQSGFRRGPDRLVGGLAGGLAVKFGFDVWITRLLILIAFLLPVIGVGLYFVLWALTPWQDASIPLERALSNRPNSR